MLQATCGCEGAWDSNKDHLKSNIIISSKFMHASMNRCDIAEIVLS